MPIQQGIPIVVILRMESEFRYFSEISVITHTFFSRIITSGSDGDIRIWQGIDDDDPNSECIGEFVNCIVHYPDRILASTDLNTVQVKFSDF